MKLTHFSVTNYRSITNAHKISLHNTTILIGKNNEGKSNVLKALNVAMICLREHATDRSYARRTYRPYRQSDRYERYEWSRDFPLHFQDRKSGLQTIFALEFELSEQDISNFRCEIGSSINGSLPIEIKIGRDNQHSLRIKEKRGKGGKALNNKSAKVAKFIANNINFTYIPTIRTNESTMEIVDSMLSSYLAELEQQVEYQKAIDKIAELQKPYLEELEIKLKSPLQEFLPNISDVKVSMTDSFRRRAWKNNFDIIINDGTPTNLEYKGDGVKSLVALSLLKDKASPDSGASIIAIEEPESHLHPGAIHQLNEVIQSLGENHQVIITTHNQLFVDRNDLKSNVIVDSGKAISCKNIKSIRDIMGIKASDNLVNAKYVLVVEGEEDIIALKAILPTLSDSIAKALDDNLLIIDSLGGASNLSYKLSMLRNSLCVYHCFMDHDEEGRKAIEKAMQDSYLKENGYQASVCQGFANSEFEDCIDTNFYKDKIKEQFGIDVTDTLFRGSDAVWSKRIKRTAKKQGKVWNDKLESQIKYAIADAIRTNPERCLQDHKRSSIDSLVDSLERLISGVG